MLTISLICDSIFILPLPGHRCLMHLTLRKEVSDGENEKDQILRVPHVKVASLVAGRSDLKDRTGSETMLSAGGCAPGADFCSILKFCPTKGMLFSLSPRGYHSPSTALDSEFPEKERKAEKHLSKWWPESPSLECGLGSETSF